MFSLGGASEAQVQALVRDRVERVVQDIVLKEVRAPLLKDREWLHKEITNIKDRLTALETGIPQLTASLAPASTESIEFHNTPVVAGTPWEHGDDASALPKVVTSSQSVVCACLNAHDETTDDEVASEQSDSMIDESGLDLYDLKCALMPLPSNQTLESLNDDFRAMPPESYFSYCWARLIRHQREGTSPTGTICRLTMMVLFEYFMAWSYMEQMDPWVYFAKPQPDPVHTECMYQESGPFPKMFDGKPTLIYTASLMSIFTIALSMKSDDEEILHTTYISYETSSITCWLLSFLWRVRTMIVAPFVGYGLVFQMVQNRYIEQVVVDSVAGCFLLELDDLFYQGLISNQEKLAYQSSEPMSLQQQRRSVGASWKLFFANVMGMIGMYVITIILLSKHSLTIITVYSVIATWQLFWIISRSMIIDDFEISLLQSGTGTSKTCHLCRLIGLSIITSVYGLFAADIPFTVLFAPDGDLADKLDKLKQCVLINQTNCHLSDFLCNSG